MAVSISPNGSAETSTGTCVVIAAAQSWPSPNGILCQRHRMTPSLPVTIFNQFMV